MKMPSFFMGKIIVTLSFLVSSITEFLILDLLIILGVIISKTATGEQRPAKNSNNYVFSL